MHHRLRALAISGLLLVVVVAGAETYEYDELGRLKAVIHDDKTTRVEYALDPAGNRTTLTTQIDTTPPSVPAGLAAVSPDSNTVNLDWSPSSDSGWSGVASYRVERCIGAGSPCSPFNEIGYSLTESYSDTTTAGTTTYQYRVRARDGADNNGDYTSPVSILTPDTIAPTAPSNLSASALGSTSVRLTWTGSTDAGGSGLASYRVERCTGSSCGDFSEIAAASTSPTQYDDATTAQLTTYRYRLRARDGAGNNSGYTSSVSATTPDTIPPTAPGNLTATAINSTTVRLQWNPSSDTGGTGVYAYWIQRCTGAGCSNFTDVGFAWASPHDDSNGTTGNTTYVYRVYARDNASPQNTGSPSNTATATTPSGVPNSPWVSSNKTILTVGGGYSISWTAVTGATYYELHRSFNGGSYTLEYSGTALFKGYSNAQAGDWTYRAKACNGAGCSTNSNAVTVTVCPSGGCQ